jgi:DNA-binding transcriptional ArsR family regulator
MPNIPEVYHLETIEQMRAVADELRQRLVEALGQQPMTITQLGKLLNESPAKVLYHVRELERVGLVVLVETREKSGALEKYYRAVAKNFGISGGLLQRVSPDEMMAIFGGWLQRISRNFMQALSEISRKDEQPLQSLVLLQDTDFWLTDEEYEHAIKQIRRLLKPYETPRGIEGERERTLVQIVYPTASSAAAKDKEPLFFSAPPQPTAVSSPSPASKERDYVIVAGSTTYSRKDLEQSLQAGKVLYIYMFGYCRFNEDVTPELIDQAIGRFRFRGKLVASPEVRAALKRKEESTEEKQ